MNRSDLNTFERLVGQIQSVYDEISLLSKKKPNDGVNKFKLKFVNTLLKSSNEFLGEGYRPFSDFAEFDFDDVPQNSDAVFILSQYLQCFERLRSDNVLWKHGKWNWRIDAPDDRGTDEEGYVYVSATIPKRLKD